MWNGQIYSKYAIVIMCLILFQNAKENNVSEYESKLIGTLDFINLSESIIICVIHKKISKRNSLLNFNTSKEIGSLIIGLAFN